VVHLLLLVLPSLGLAGGLVLAQRSIDSLCSLDCFYEFARLYGGLGFAGADMPIFGVHSVVFAGFVLAVATSGRTAASHVGHWRIGNGEFQAGDDLSTVRIAAITLGAAVFGLLGLSYYVNRSFAQLLLAVFLPLAISSMGMLTLLVRESAPNTLAERLWLFPLVVVCLVPVLSVPRLPALDTEWSRLSGDISPWIYPFETEFPVIDTVLQEVEARFGAFPAEWHSGVTLTERRRVWKMVGAGGAQMGRWAWGSSFVDINGDGWDDLVVANGYITTEDTGDL